GRRAHSANWSARSWRTSGSSMSSSSACIRIVTVGSPPGAMLPRPRAYPAVVSQRVVILNGPAGVGKTTIGRLLAARSANGVCIHGDVLADFIVTREDEAVELGLAYVNGATLAANSIRAGYELVVFEYCFEAARHVQRFLDAYDAEAPVSMFTLWAPLETIVERAGRRVDRRPLGDRVEACYRSMESNLAELGEVVDNLAAPEDVAAALD